MGEAAEGLALGAMPVGKYLGDKNPDDRSLADGVGRDEGEDADRHQRKMIGKKGPGDQAERNDVTERANIKQRAPAQPVNQPESDKSENQIGDADADGLQQRGFCAEAGQFKDAGREVQNRIDAGELVEEGDQDGEQNRLLKTRRPEMS